MVGSTVEVINYGGQVGGSASGCKDCNEVGLGRMPTGMFFLTPTAHPNPQKKETAAQVFKVTDGVFGLFQYAGETSKEDEARSRWQIYSHVETDLYPAITARTGHGYQAVKAFDPKRYDYYRELHYADSLDFYQGRPAAAKPSVKKPIVRKARRR